MSIEVFNESGRAEINEEELIDAAQFALWTLDVHSAAELSIHIIDEETMADLHKRWMDLPGPTDVMSFPIDELTPGWGRKDGPPPSPAMLGDIMLCPDFAQGQADRAGHSLGHELDLLTVHGVLHLLGFDHGTPDEEQRMFALQNEILANWYDSQAERGVSFGPKPTGPGAFPTAAQRDDSGSSAQQPSEKSERNGEKNDDSNAAE
ncbi:rRNA maturation RNase YbeY [Corynebacterium heidelbergense]|uniref:Endoribonuclease YbeY n=1 Tax=Corynebacterium heidelbergense TaxID=2055947 RepID=A0A364VDG0_9CORY|nr:rRNA maturation RNase YbeY [Corynebacterium heidelbergense]RAV34685.1 rRNA maturation RNase YbeY [Corynebacterium heidelbergense]WCZ36261.1 Endoribonuclease YbeY [Corynebacterium heidelbergense]